LTSSNSQAHFLAACCEELQLGLNINNLIGCPKFMDKCLFTNK
jgi:hypothetical protein